MKRAEKMRVDVVPAEDLDDLDRWVEQYAQAVARLEGVRIPLSSTGQAA